ncbi:MAG TPA: AAA family ATPase [Rectinemataceae bacterium]
MALGENPLFSSAGRGSREPLAYRMRPRNLDEFIGQEHIVGPGRLLRRAIQRDQLSSIILSGPPGTGKTTLARIIANTTKSGFTALNAVLSGVGELREAIEKARAHHELYSLKTILFVDEVHRWNKSQQDALLPWVENGTVVLVGATTENPFFEVNRALVSRSRVFLLRALGSEDMKRIALQALGDAERGYGAYSVVFERGALEHLVDTADGDARSLLNALELAVETSVPSWPPEPGTRVDVSLQTAEESIQKKVVLYDKDGDYHYDTISAFIKSLRGSDPDAALYWLARMVYAGEDPGFIFRRMLISAAEDVGLADPEAVGRVLACAQAFDRIGLPEGQFHLAEAALYLASAPKSNSALGYFDALKAVETEGAEVPSHLKDGSRDAAGFGHGQGYKYPHAYTDHWVAQQYLPRGMSGRVFYQPGMLGYEGGKRSEILERREAQLACGEDDADGTESSVWSREGERLGSWESRAEGDASSRLRGLRSLVFDLLGPSRSSSILVFDPRKGFYALEALRRCPEGTVAAFLPEAEDAGFLERLTENLPQASRPAVAAAPLLEPDWTEKAFGFSRFDSILLGETTRMIRSGLPDAWEFAAFALGSMGEPTPGILAFDIMPESSALLSELLRQNQGAWEAEDDVLAEDIARIEKGAGKDLETEEKRIFQAMEKRIGEAGLGGLSWKYSVERIAYPWQEPSRILEASHPAVKGSGKLVEALGERSRSRLARLLGRLGPEATRPLFIFVCRI